MSRVLNEEYRKYVLSDTPDLWSRIEPELHEKKPAQSDQTLINEKQRKSDMIKVYILKYSGFIAAGICLAILIPILFWNRSAENTNQTESSSRTDLLLSSDMSSAVDADAAEDAGYGKTEAIEESIAQDTQVNESLQSEYSGTSMDTEDSVSLTAEEELQTRDILVQIKVTGEMEENLYLCDVISGLEDSMIYIQDPDAQLIIDSTYSIYLQETGEVINDNKVYLLISIE